MQETNRNRHQELAALFAVLTCGALIGCGGGQTIAASTSCEDYLKTEAGIRHDAAARISSDYAGLPSRGNPMWGLSLDAACSSHRSMTIDEYFSRGKRSSATESSSPSSGANSDGSSKGLLVPPGHPDVRALSGKALEGAAGGCRFGTTTGYHDNPPTNGTARLYCSGKPEQAGFVDIEDQTSSAAERPSCSAADGGRYSCSVRTATTYAGADGRTLSEAKARYNAEILLLGGTLHDHG